MKREQRDFDAKTNQQSSHEQKLGWQPQLTAEDRPQAEIHCSGDERESEERPKDQHSRHSRDDQELGCGIGPIRSSPNSN